MRPGLLTFAGTDARALAGRGGGALPSVRPGCAKGSVSLDSEPQMLPIVELVGVVKGCGRSEPCVLGSGGEGGCAIGGGRSGFLVDRVYGGVRCTVHYRVPKVLRTPSTCTLSLGQ